jgi:hypothetical protein
MSRTQILTLIRVLFLVLTAVSLSRADMVIDGNASDGRLDRAPFRVFPGFTYSLELSSQVFDSQLRVLLAPAGDPAGFVQPSPQNQVLAYRSSEPHGPISVSFNATKEASLQALFGPLNRVSGPYRFELKSRLTDPRKRDEVLTWLMAQREATLRQIDELEDERSSLSAESSFYGGLATESFRNQSFGLGGYNSGMASGLREQAISTGRTILDLKFRRIAIDEHLRVLDGGAR